MATYPLYHLLFLLVLSPPQVQPLVLPFAQYKTLISLSHSLITRVAAARDARGDLAGAARARDIADKLRLLGGGLQVWAVGWDFAWNYALRGGLPTAEVYGAGADFFDAVGEVTGLDSVSKRSCWMIRNYERVVGLANPLFRNLLRVFSKSGPLREAIMVLQKEVVEGELLKDCMEVGAKDLDGLIYLAKDLFSFVGSRDSEL